MEFRHLRTPPEPGVYHAYWKAGVFEEERAPQIVKVVKHAHLYGGRPMVYRFESDNPSEWKDWAFGDLIEIVAPGQVWEYTG